MPKASDTVTVKYRGTTIDGKEFDASDKHGGTASFPVNGVIPGWTEALQKMKVGSTGNSTSHRISPTPTKVRAPTSHRCDSDLRCDARQHRQVSGRTISQRQNSRTAYPPSSTAFGGGAALAGPFPGFLLSPAGYCTDDPVKIAYLFSRYPVPSQTFCDTEIRALEAAGHEVEIYSCSAPTTSFRHGPPTDWPRAPVHYAPPPDVLAAWELAARADGTWPGEMVAEHTARFGPRYDPARRARHALYFADRLRRRGVEHVHVHFANRATHAALFIHALTGVTWSFTAHAQDFLVDLGSDALLRLLCERAAFVVTVSDWSRAALLARCPAAAAKVTAFTTAWRWRNGRFPATPTSHLALLRNPACGFSASVG